MVLYNGSSEKHKSQKMFPIRLVRQLTESIESKLYHGVKDINYERSWFSMLNLQQGYM